MSIFEAYTEDGKLQYNAAAHHYFFSAKVTLSINVDEAVANSGDFTPGWPALGQTTYMGPLGFPMAFPDWSAETVELYKNDIFVINSAVPIFPHARAHTPTTITVYRFRPFTQLPIVDRSALGLQLFDASGNLTYDALKRALTCVATVNIAAMTSGMNVALGLPAGRTYAWRETDHRRILSALPANYTLFDNRVKAFNANQLAIRQAVGGDVYLSESNRTAFGSANIYAPPIHIFDVTGL